VQLEQELKAQEASFSTHPHHFPSAPPKKTPTPLPLRPSKKNTYITSPPPLQKKCPYDHPEAQYCKINGV